MVWRHRTQPDVSGASISRNSLFLWRRRFPVIVVLPYYLHNYQQFVRLTLLGELLAVTRSHVHAFHLRRLGQPSRIFNIVLHPQLKS